jgi:hypothetical protein
VFVKKRAKKGEGSSVAGGGWASAPGIRSTTIKITHPELPPFHLHNTRASTSNTVSKWGRMIEITIFNFFRPL